MAKDDRWLWTHDGAEAPQETVLKPTGEVLREIRAERGLTQAELASILHLDQSYVSKIERGRQVRDIGQLLSMATALAIPPQRLGISDTLAQVASSRSGAQPVNAPDVAAMSGAAVRASQDEWRSVRRYLNQHRSELAHEAVRLYGETSRLGGTTLITRPEWIPRTPVDLENITLDWAGTGERFEVTGTEPELHQVCPLHAPGRRYDRYTAAIRYLDPPTLFENRASYRLLGLEFQPGAGQMQFGLATYFDKLDVSEALGHEHALARLAADKGGPLRDSGFDQLPFRALVGDPFDFRKRAVIPAITTITIRVDPTSGNAAFLLHWRDPKKVATAGGVYDVIPAGEFQPSSIAGWDQANDFDIWRNIVRELSEELLGAPEHDGSRGLPIDYEAWPLYKALGKARDDGKLWAGCLGVGLDALTLAATIMTVLVFDGPTFDAIFGQVVQVNSEGRIVSAGPKTTVNDGVPFTSESVERMLTSEPMAAPGAACLHLAWRHRDALLGAIE